MRSRSECLVDEGGDALSRPGDVNAGTPLHRRLGQIEGGDQDAVDVVGPLSAADLTPLNAVGDRPPEVDEAVLALYSIFDNHHISLIISQRSFSVRGSARQVLQHCLQRKLYLT